MSESTAPQNLKDSLQPRNLFDRFFEAVSPSRAQRRYAARLQMAAARSVPESSYRGAISTRTSDPWSPSLSVRGGSVLDRIQLATMCERGRNVFRNNIVARSMLKTEADNVIADGFTLQLRSKSDAWNSEGEERFYRWLDRADITGMRCGSELFRASWIEPRKDGDGGFALILDNGYPRLQYIPRDWIVNPLDKFDPATMYDGVQTNAAGRPIRFFVRDTSQYGKPNVVGIDADDFVYLAHPDDPLAVRGMTVYGPIFEHLDQLDSYVDSVTKAAIMACIFGLIHKVNKPSNMLNPLAAATNAQGQTQKAISLENGMLRVEGTDESTYQVTPGQPMNQTPDFIRALMRIICLAFDMPLEIGQKDLSQVNFSGGRIGLIGYYRSCRVKQDWLKSRCWNRIVFWWLSKERERQRLGYSDAFRTPFPEDYGNFELVGREWEYNDPVTEAQADLLEINAGFQSYQGACAKRGRDFGDILVLNAKARGEAHDKGIPMPLSSYTRDEPLTPAGDGSADAPSVSEIDNVKIESDAYGIAVRAGALTPQTDDEDYFRGRLKLPAMSAAARAIWSDQKGVRQPITLAQPGTSPTPAPAEQPPETKDEQ